MTDKSKQTDPLFEQAMSDVQPLKKGNKKWPAHRRPEKPTLAQSIRRDRAVRSQLKDPNPLFIPEQVPLIGPHDIVGRKKDGVQEGVYRKLRLGKYDIQGHLDLHRLTLAEARKEVWLFIDEASQAGLRTLLITHGKGYHSSTPGRLKSYTLFWLDQLEEVLAYHSAKPQHGGAGATYLLLKKSEQAKQKNREHFYKGRTS